MLIEKIKYGNSVIKGAFYLSEYKGEREVDLKKISTQMHEL